MLYKKLLRLFVSVCIIFSGYATYRFCHKKTGGFAIAKIRKAFELDENEVTPKELSSILSQPLHYIGKGGQCYAFATKDEKYVVKFLKYNNNYPKIWFRLIPFPFGLEKYRQEKIASKKKSLAKEYESYSIAKKHFKEATGILYFHLNKGGLEGKTVEIKDKIGIVHRIPIDTFQFYVQKKGTPFYPGLVAMIKNNEIPALKNILKELSQFLWFRCTQHVVDTDNGIWRNFALMDHHPVQIDIGQFSYSQELDSYEGCKKTLLWFTTGFREWLEEQSPELANYFLSTLLVAPNES